jgi:hypothetical protein
VEKGLGVKAPYEGVEEHLVTQAVQKCLDARRPEQIEVRKP